MSKVFVLKAMAGGRRDDPPRTCEGCGATTYGWISPEGRETEYILCSDCYRKYHGLGDWN